MKAALLLLALVSAAGAQTVPSLTGRVVDTADMLSPATEAAITARLAAFEDSTSAQIVVLTVATLSGDDIERFATDVGRAWGIGQAGSSNGALLLVVRDDHLLRLEVGYGLEGALTDARAATIIREIIVPRMRDGDPDAAISAGVDAMIASAGDTAIAPAPPDPTPWWALALFGGLFTILPVVGLWVFLRTGFAGFWGTVAAGIVGLVLGACVAAGVSVGTGSSALSLGAFVLMSLGAVILDVWLERHPVYGPARRAWREAPAQSSGVHGSASSGSNGHSSGGSSSFSGGGGSLGGGGASGSW